MAPKRDETSQDIARGQQIDRLASNARSLAHSLNLALDALGKLGVMTPSVIGHLSPNQHERFAPLDFSRVRLLLEFTDKGE